MITIICTVGTSALDKLKHQHIPWEYSKTLNPLWYAKLNEEKFKLDCSKYARKGVDALDEKYLENIKEKYAQLHNNEDYLKWDKIKWRLMPAEVGSVLRIIQNFKIDPVEAEVVLLQSDTAEAYLSAKAIQSILSNIGVKIPDEKVVSIEGFQMENQTRFKEEGLYNFVKNVQIILNTKSEKNETLQLFNITGGYKNFIPLVTHISSFHRKDMYYVFEEAVGSGVDSLLRIPRIPTMNRIPLTRYQNIIDLLEEIKRDEIPPETMLEDFIIQNLYKIFKETKESNETVIKHFKEFILDFVELKDGRPIINMIGDLYLYLMKNKIKGVR
ncbi:hypothetical protein [Bacillus sp. 165]|uniref:hypothetical protein n=1 Tax=Bacillus sp. 165 TaxID=1529117 RepID=UPI001ADB73C9|nr:hypothetical protein [Bacillus sp. 165]MBO9129093.1 hypothetical protein [Bacillus sp. 165]